MRRFEISLSDRPRAFHREYRDVSTFNRAMNTGLKIIGNEIGVSGLTFYSARHSMATIAANEVGIDTDSSMKITELYIR